MRDVRARDVLLDVVDLLLETGFQKRSSTGTQSSSPREMLSSSSSIAGGEVVIDVALEVAGQEAVDDLAEVGRR